MLLHSEKHFHTQSDFFIFKEILYIQRNCIFKKTFLHSEKVFISIEIVVIQRDIFLSKKYVDIKKNQYIQRKPKIQISNYLS